MALLDSTNEPIFEETQISSRVTENEVLHFFQHHGIFYESDAEIGRLVTTLGGAGLNHRNGIDAFKTAYMKKPRCRKLLEYFRPDFAYVMGADGYYYASTTSEKQSRDRITVYMWRPNTSLEFAEKSHICSFETVDTSAYRMCIIPYVQIRTKCKEIPLQFKDGGILIVHPRFAIRGQEGSAYVYAGSITY